MLINSLLQCLDIISLNSASDTSELLGGFEQVGHFERLAKVCLKVGSFLDARMEWAVGAQRSDCLAGLVNLKLEFERAAESEDKERVANFLSR